MAIGCTPRRPAGKNWTDIRCGWSSSTAKRHSKLVALRLHLWQPTPGRASWGRDGTLGQIKAFILADMIGDKDLDIQREDNSTDWLVGLVRPGGEEVRLRALLFPAGQGVEDDHLPFVERGVPSIDVIDLDYGPNNSYHHTAQDTMDKISARSLTIDGDVFMETIRLVDQR